jgi:hypothetical protein
MLRFHTFAAALAVTLCAGVAAAQPASPAPKRDSLVNGTLIGLGAGVASVAVLDAAFCDNGFGNCDFPWTAVLVLGGIGAGAGAGIDFLIGRDSGRTTTLRLSPIISDTRKGVRVSLMLPARQDRAKPVTRPTRGRALSFPEFSATVTIGRE